ncbi:hypothetical protein P8629_01510 [Hydrogenovibrio sp. 3SP14C1]|uniref:hypothetical protein n=1 Tax=Hydrogenovibrio sp. 3SP14C1 TaxID=3038774 RepID=UPI00241742FF|nr:hypothetical protein [Hydrogenovibrio sp. 3SP14C1]MDG4811673.1 hypothetical protein [Hydrogenovibrio sp. 3SP14C1]
MSVANFIGTILLALYLFMTSRSRVNTGRIDKLETHTDGRIDKLEQHFSQQVSEHDKRFERIEEHNKHVPTHEDFKRVYDKINVQSDQLNRLAGESRSQNETLKLIHQYLLSEGKK